jgi:hypothetical protein
MAERKTITRNCKNCTREFRTNIKNIDNINFSYCAICRKHHKNCEICGKEIFVQAKTCSKECAYELRKKSWQKTCGAKHNFSKKSSSRITWEKRLKDEEGIDNVFQRESVKKKTKETWHKKHGADNPSKVPKIKQKKVETCLRNHSVTNGWLLTEKVNDTMLKKYGQLRITNGEKISKTRREILRPKMEELGIWIPLSELSERQSYTYNVWAITKEQIRNYGHLINSELLKENKNINEWKEKWSIDHKFSIKEGWKQKISPEIIGSIINLEIISFSSNSSKQSKCSITLEKLIKNYNIFINENKIN